VFLLFSLFSVSFDCGNVLFGRSLTLANTNGDFYETCRNKMVI